MRWSRVNELLVKAQAMCLPWIVALHGDLVALRVTGEVIVAATRNPSPKKSHCTIATVNACTTAVPKLPGRDNILRCTAALAVQKHLFDSTSKNIVAEKGGVSWRG